MISRFLVGVGICFMALTTQGSEKKMVAEKNQNSVELKEFFESNPVLQIGDLRKVVFGYLGNMQDIHILAPQKKTWYDSSIGGSLTPVRTMEFSGDNSVLRIICAGSRVKKKGSPFRENFKIITYNFDSQTIGGLEEALSGECCVKFPDVAKEVTAKSLNGNLTALCRTNPSSDAENHLVSEHIISIFHNQQKELEQLCQPNP